MPMFDPKKAKEQNSNQGIPPGPYLLAIKRFERRKSKAGNAYLHCLIVVIAGPAKKRTFWDNISLDMSNSGSMFRLSMLAEQCGVEQQFDLDDDKAITDNLVGRPFKADISRKLENGYVNNGIAKYLNGDKITDADRKVMESWVAEQADQAEWGGNGGTADRDAPPPGDEDSPWGTSDGGGASRDDDIPF